MGKLIPSLLLGFAFGIAACGPPYPVPGRPNAATSARPPPVEIPNAKPQQHSQRKEARAAR
jgi:hypothetical protein